MFIVSFREFPLIDIYWTINTNKLRCVSKCLKVRACMCVIESAYLRVCLVYVCICMWHNLNITTPLKTIDCLNQFWMAVELAISETLPLLIISGEINLMNSFEIKMFCAFHDKEEYLLYPALLLCNFRFGFFRGQLIFTSNN